MARAWIWIMTAALESTSVALGMGVSWGDGVLSCGGTTRPFSVRGLKLTLAGEGSRSS